MEELTHFRDGKASMVDISDKDETLRYAKASGNISMMVEAIKILKTGGSKKGDVLGVSRLAGINAAKRTSELIPLSHNLRISSVNIDFNISEEESTVHATCEVRGIDRSGFEMEALTGVTIALLTIYDMMKSVDRSMVIKEIYLLEKSGGKSGHFKRPKSRI